MGRYDPPHFDTPNESLVSVWVATTSHDDIPADYWACDFTTGDDNPPWNRFSEDFGFGYYDDDITEANHAMASAGAPVGELVAQCSYGRSFAKAVGKKAGELGVLRTCFVFLMYNFRYQPAQVTAPGSPYLRFIGVFAFDEGCE